MNSGFITSKDKIEKMVRCDHCRRIMPIVELKEIVVTKTLLGFNLNQITKRWCDDCIEIYNDKQKPKI